MNPMQASAATRFRVGVFTLLGLLLLGAITVFVNDKPYWWRPCELVHINVEDATGLKGKSPVRSLGIQIGYLRGIELSETHVRLGICITAPVEVLPATRAYIRGEGFLGDKFVELKPVRYIQPPAGAKAALLLDSVLGALVDQAHAEPGDAKSSARRGDIPVGEKSQDVQQLVDEVDGLVNEMRSLTTNLKESFDPGEMKSTLQRLNKTLENASRTLSPEGGLTTTAQRTLAKLEDAIEQMRDLMTRVNRGEGSVGMLMNDPSYAEEIRDAVRNINRLVGKAGGIRFNLNMGAQLLPAHNQGGRGYFQAAIFPEPSRYYLIGLAVDPRGSRRVTQTTTVAGGQTYTNEVTQVETNGVLFTGMLGKILWRRLNLAAGLIYGDGALRVGLMLGPHMREEMLVIDNDVFSRGAGVGIDYRATAYLRPLVNRSTLFGNLYVSGGLDSVKKVSGKTSYSVGAGITFDDEDIKLLFALR